MQRKRARLADGYYTGKQAAEAFIGEKRIDFLRREKWCEQ